MISNKKILAIIDTMRRMATSKLAVVVASRGWNQAMVTAIQHEDPTEIVDDLQHVLFMCAEMETMVKAGRRDKWNRWLGWAQKTLQIHRVCTKEEMKVLNKPDRKPPEGVKPTRIHTQHLVTDGSYLVTVSGSEIVDKPGAKADLWYEAKEALELGLLAALNRLADEDV